jgi:hypothetical protein
VPTSARRVARLLAGGVMVDHGAFSVAMFLAGGGGISTRPRLVSGPMRKLTPSWRTPDRARCSAFVRRRGCPEPAFTRCAARRAAGWRFQWLYLVSARSVSTCRFAVTVLVFSARPGIAPPRQLSV